MSILINFDSSPHRREPPLDNDDLLQLYDDILNTEPHFDSDFTDDARDVIQRFLAKEPENRFGIWGSGVWEIKCHPFFASIDWDLLAQKKLPSPFGNVSYLQNGLEPFFDEEEEPPFEPLTPEEQNMFLDF